MRKCLTAVFVFIIQFDCFSQAASKFVDRFISIYDGDKDFRTSGDLMYLANAMIFRDDCWYETPDNERRGFFFDYLNMQKRFDIIYVEAYDLINKRLYKNGRAWMDWVEKIPRCIRKRRLFTESNIEHGVEKYQRQVYALINYLSNNPVDYLFDIEMYQDVQPMHWIIRNKELRVLLYSEDSNEYMEYDPQEYISSISRSHLFHSKMQCLPH